MHKSPRRAFTIALTLGLSLAVGGSAAYAVTATYAGSDATDMSAFTLRSRDTADDGLFVKATSTSNYGTYSEIVNKQGPFSVIEKKLHSGGEVISKIQACRANSVTPMSCSAWVPTGRF